MSEVARGGRTVLFVSHNMGAIRRLCQRCILSERGRVKIDASVQDAIDLYLTQAADGLGSGVFVRERPLSNTKVADVPADVEKRGAALLTLSR